MPGREYIVNQLQKRGLSRRRALYILNHVLDCMAKALQSGESVETPLGDLRVIDVKRKPSRGWYLGKIITNYKYPKTVVLKRKERNK